MIATTRGVRDRHAVDASPLAPSTREEQPARIRPPSDLVRRLVARVADAGTVLAVIWAMVVLRVLWFIPAYSDVVDPRPWGSAFVVTVTFAVLHLLYEVVFLRWNKGQTPGRDWMHLRVVSVDGGDLDVLRAARRALAPALVVLVPPALLGAVLAVAMGATALVSSRRRSIPDVLAGTVVIEWDRDAHEPVDPRMLRKRPRVLGIISGLTRPDRAVADDPIEVDHPQDPVKRRLR